MPMQLTWTPNTGPTMKKGDKRLVTTDDIVDRGLEISGDDPSITGVVDGRVKLVEQEGKGAGAGTHEPSTGRVLATFHGKFHSDPKAARNARITFEIFIGSATATPHTQDVQGFDPECIFGIDALVLTFVNREFVIFFPFHVDTDREGSFLEVVAIAETGAIDSPTEVARSSVLSLGIRRNHAVNTTSNSNGVAIAYTGDQIGNLVLTPEGYILLGSVKSPASTADEIILSPAMIAVRLPNAGVTFAPYKAGSLQILLLTDLLDDLLPPDGFLTTAIKGVDATNVAKLRADGLLHLKTIETIVADLFKDAGFTGAKATWSDDTAAAAQLKAFTAAFSRQSMRGHFWRLSNANKPLVTSFWNFFVASSDQNQEAGTGERYATAPVATPTAHKIDGREIFLNDVFPLGSGDKKLANPIEIGPGIFAKMLRESSGVPRKYQDAPEFLAAVDEVAAKLALLIAHEVAHALGLMHHSVVRDKANYSEKGGSPVLSIMSSSVESGGFGFGIKFSAQAKIMWSAAFGVTSQPDDTILKNKVWSNAEVFTKNWGDRKNRFIKKHGEVRLPTIQLGSQQPIPPFAKVPPDAQRGTFKP